MLIEAIFATRGIVFLLERTGLLGGIEIAESSRGALVLWTARALAAVMLFWSGIGIAHAARVLEGAEAATNESQHQLLTLIERVSDPGDPIYDNSGSYVARPNAYFLPWTDEPIRRIWADKLIREVPTAIEESDCVVAIVDPRFQSLPEALREYLLAHFKPYAGPVLLWGWDFESPTGRVDSTFLANRGGRYRVFPEAIAEEGGLRVDGKAISSVLFELAEGDHEVHYDGRRGGFRLQWAPPDRDASH
jgi:hypothetical protein